MKLRENHGRGRARPRGALALTVAMAMTEAVALSTDGRREVPGIAVMPREAETFRSDFLRFLTRHGLRGPCSWRSAARTRGPKAFVGQTVHRPVCRSFSR